MEGNKRYGKLQGLMDEIEKGLKKGGLGTKKYRDPDGTEVMEVTGGKKKKVNTKTKKK